MKNKVVSFICLLTCFFFSCGSNDSDSYRSWPVYGGSPEMIRYSSLKQIDTNNVSQLKVAWTYSSGDVDTAHHSQIQCNPIIVDGILIFHAKELQGLFDDLVFFDTPEQLRYQRP